MTDAPKDPSDAPENIEGPGAVGHNDPFAAPAAAEQAAAEQAAAEQAAAEQVRVAPVAAEQSSREPVTAEPTADYAQAAQSAQPAADRRTFSETTVGSAFAQRGSRTVIIAALAVGALVGGAAGAGVFGLISSSDRSNAVSTTNVSPQNVTINDTENVNVVTAVAAKAEPSVVTIAVTGTSAAGTGSGIILSKDGYILTNTHVVTLDGATGTAAIQVTTADGHLFEATLVGTDPIVDLAVIKLKNASDLTPITFADSSKLNVGQTAIAIGAPLGLSNTVTTGIVSALNRSISIASSAAPAPGSNSEGGQGSSSPFDFWQFDNGQGSSATPSAAATTLSLPVIQTDAAINPGNSGGALLNANAQVIGINVAIASAGGSSSSTTQSGNIGVGFAIPSNLAQRIANEIIKNGAATHGLLGATVQDVTSAASSSVVGASIKTVTSGGAAAAAGVKAGDVITAFNGVPITSSTDLTAQVRYLAAGATSTLTYVRGGQPTTVDVTVGTLK